MSGVARKLETRDPIDVLREEKLITAGDLKRALSTEHRPVTLDWVTRWMRIGGCGFQLKRGRGKGKRGGPWFTTRGKLEKTYPEVLDLVLQDRLERAEAGDDL